MAEGMTTVVLRLLSKSNRGRFRLTNALWKTPGVSSIVVDVDEQTLTVKGYFDTNLVLKIAEKNKKLVEVWHTEAPPPPPPGEEPPPSVIELKVPLHCPGCKRRVLAAVCQLRGVQKVDTDMENQKVVVTGYVDPGMLLAKIRTTRKRAEVISVSILEVPKETAEEEP